MVKKVNSFKEMREDIGNDSFEDIWEMIEQSQRVLMSLHPKPDGDSLGSCSAMKYVLEKMGKQVTLVSKDELSEGLKGFSFVEEIEMEKDLTEMDFKEFDILILLDHGSINGYSKSLEEKLKDIIVINIDHHNINSHGGNLRYVDSKSPSACSVLIEMFQKMGVKFDKELSLRLSVGVSTDTGFFSHGNSNQAFKDMAFLVENGVDYHKDIFLKIAGSVSLKVKKLHGILLNNLKIEKFGGVNIAHSFVGKKDIEKLELEPSDVRLGIMVLQDIKDADIVLAIAELEDGAKGSFRSVDVDVSLFAKELGGGGHKAAAAFVLENVSLEEAKKKVFEAIKKVGIHKIKE